MNDKFPPIGTRVKIVDGSEAHGDEGVVLDLQNGVCVILLDQGCAWPVCDVSEILILED